MNLISAKELSKAYSEKRLFNDISFGIDTGNKIGLIGINGTGKSTLLKVIAGSESADNGEIIKNSSLKIEYLSQNPDFDHEISVMDQIFKGDSPLMRLLREYEKALSELEAQPDNEQLQKKLTDINQQMDMHDAWQIESEAKAVLYKLGIFNTSELIGNLSGGQRKRVAMAAALIRPCDLLILDEPTNHIDNETIQYLEEYLLSTNKALLMVTHDRYFLNRVVNRIWEIEDGRLFTYEGDYTKFLELKSQREYDEKKIQEKKQSLYKSELAWIRKGVEARRTKQKARKDRFEDLKNEIDTRSGNDLEISVASTRLGTKIVELEHVSKSFDGKKVVDDFSYILLKDDRIGIVGKNGEGKSTLLNIIADRLKADSGSIEIGETVKIGYYSQESMDMDESLRVIEYIKEKAEYIKTADGVSISASQMLENFLFDKDMQWSYISKLSGGERRRVYLLSVLMDAPNVLLLDEPTNDLDIQTLSILEQYIAGFSGPVITVSHDRYFLDKIANKIFSYEGNGSIRIYNGDYTTFSEKKREDENISKKDFGSKKDMNANISKDEKNKASQSKSSGMENEAKSRNQKTKFTFKEQMEYDNIESDINKAEEELSKIASEIEKSSSDFTRLEELLKDQRAQEEKLEHLMKRWEYLMELAESFEIK